MIPEEMRVIFELVASMFGVKFENVRANMSLADDLGADSLDTIEFLMAIEERFDIEIEDAIVSQFTTIGDYVTYVEELGLEPNDEPFDFEFPDEHVI